MALKIQELYSGYVVDDEVKIAELEEVEAEPRPASGPNLCCS